MKKLIAGMYSLTNSLSIYECENGVLKDATDDYVSQKEYKMIIDALNEQISNDAHFLIRENAEEWFCEYIARYVPQLELFVIAYG